MRQLGITGNIGSGKSMVCRIFEMLGVPVYDADERARQITNSPGLLMEIKQLFGEQVFDGPKMLNRKRLGEIVFADRDKIRSLNRLIHPKVYQDYLDWLKTLGNVAFCLQESAILVETGSWKRFDALIVVSAPTELRIERVMKRDALSRPQVMQRIGNQLPQEELEEKAHHVIINDGHQPLIPQVLDIYQKWQSAS